MVSGEADKFTFGKTEFIGAETKDSAGVKRHAVPPYTAVGQEDAHAGIISG